MFPQHAYHVRTDHSFVDFAYRLVDWGAIACAALASVRFGDPASPQSFVVICAATVGAHMVGMEVSGLYRTWRGARLTMELWCVLTTWLFVAPAVLGLGMLTRYNAVVGYSTKTLWLTLTPAAIASGRIALRLALREFFRRGFNRRRAAICGVNPLGVQLADKIRRSPQLGIEFVGCFDDRSQERTEQHAGDQVPHAGTLTDVVAMARNGQVDMILITFPMRAEERIRQLLAELSDSTASVYIVPDFFVFQLLHARWNQIDDLPMVSLFETPISGIDGVLKRGFDLTVASLALLALAFPLAVVSLAVKLTSPGPVFFRQNRYGLAGEEIRVWKFRSMCVCENGPHVAQAAKNDDRLTPLGRFLRRTSLDELPQLFNVVDGSMSLVGPRPHASAHNEQYRSLIDGYMLRHKVKPGITGLAQVDGWRGETETLEKMARRGEFDHRYIREWSLWLDLRILFKTLAVLWKQVAAY